MEFSHHKGKSTVKCYYGQRKENAATFLRLALEPLWAVWFLRVLRELGSIGGLAVQPHMACWDLVPKPALHPSYEG